MPAPLDLDPTTSVATYFGARLRRLRQAADLTQEQLGDLINYTGSLIGQIETARKSPTLEFARACDTALDSGGDLADLWKLLKNSPDWLDTYIQEERQATLIETFEPIVISGLFQTEAYARLVIAADRPSVSVEQVEQDLAVRCDRQRILSRTSPPHVWLIQDEVSLLRPVGGRDVMREQLETLLTAELSEKVVLQVLPLDVGTHASLKGPLTILETKRGTTLGYSESHSSAEYVTEPDAVAEWRLAFNMLRAAALSPTDSARHLSKILEDRYR